jgi:hypothetical protein
MLRVDEGHKALDKLVRTYGQLNLADANEAETRLKVIDEVLFTVLGWLKEDIAPEERVLEDGTTSFADYIVRTASTAFLIEAKRVGAAFSLPPKRMRLKLGGVLSEGEAGDAIRQARDYCRKKSIPFAVVTNGNTWIIFPAVRTDQVTFEESEARIFRSIDEIKARFVEFWELLSRERVLDGNLENELIGGRQADEAHRVLRQLLPEPGYRLGRNSLYEHIEPAVAEALSDESLLDNPDSLAACYVKTTERLKFDNRLQMHLRDPAPPLGHHTVRVKTRKNVGRLEERIASTGPKATPRFIVLLGPVGAGKTTFLHYTRKVSAATAIDGQIVWLMVDFKKATALDNPRTFILNELLTAIETDEEFSLGDWHESIRSAYSPLIDALRKGPLYLLSKNDPAEFEKRVAEQIGRERESVEPYTERILKHASTKWPGFLIIDNVDQLDDLDLQERIFIEAQAIARRIGFSVIMSLRESTYLRHRDRPIFDAFQFESFYIDPPNVLPVLSHRFGYAKKVLEGKSVYLRTERGISISVPDLSRFFDIVSHSILDDDAGFMLECLAGNNIRRGLSLVREFLASGHTNADRAIAAYLNDGDYKFPRHEVFKGAVLGSSKYFNDALSLIPNIYDSKLGGYSFQLLRLQLVHQMVQSTTERPSEGLLFTDLAGPLGRMGVTEHDLQSVVEDLFKRGLIRTTDGLVPRPDSSLFPTRLAGFSLRQMCREFTYAEFCCVDAVIWDNDTWDELREITDEIESAHGAAERVKLRADRIDIFFDYLARSEERWIVECRRRDLPLNWHTQIVQNEIRPVLRKNVEIAIRSAERTYGREPPVRTPVGQRAQSTDQETRHGTIVNSWHDKDYVFIRDDEGTEWFGHRTDFLTDNDWRQRDRGRQCAFLRGEWQGKPRATAVRVEAGNRSTGR